MANSERRKKHDNNVALAHCVNNSEGRKIVKAHKGFALRPCGKTALFLKKLTNF